MSTAASPAGRSRRRRATALACVVAGLTMAGTGLTTRTAHAEIRDRWHVEFSYENSFEQCGFNIDLTGIEEIRGYSRDGTGSQAGLFPGVTNDEYTDTWTNAENGKYFMVHRRATYIQAASHNLGGTVWRGTFRINENLQVIDSSGNVVVRQAMQGQYDQVFDDNGDSVPGETTISEVVRNVGHQTLSTWTDEQLCAGLTNLIG